MLRNWKKTAFQQEFHKGVAWRSWKRWEKSCDGCRRRLNSQKRDKENPTIFALTEEMKRWKWRPQWSGTYILKLTKNTTISASTEEMETKTLPNKYIESDKKTISASTEEMENVENGDPKVQELQYHIKTDKRNNDFCLDRRNGEPKARELVHSVERDQKKPTISDLTEEMQCRLTDCTVDAAWQHKSGSPWFNFSTLNTI